MERTTTEGRVIYLGELEFTGLMKQLITWYKFQNNNQLPERIVLPNIKEVDGVPITPADKVIVEYNLEELAIEHPTTESEGFIHLASRKKEVSHAPRR